MDSPSPDVEHLRIVLAAVAMHALIAPGFGAYSRADIVKDAVAIADALLAELAKAKP